MKYSKYLKKNKLAIFLVHGVVNNVSDNQIINYTNKHITASKFEQILVDLKKKGTCLSMDEVFQRFKSKKKFEEYCYAITFDDGFYNNYSIAIPILEKHKQKATFYVTTDFINNNQLSWIDIIEILIEKNKKGTIKTFWGNENFSSSKISKINLLNKIRKKIKKNKKIDPYQFAQNISNQLNQKGKNFLKNIFFKKMNWKNLQTIKKNKLFIIGGHGKTHRILGYLNKKNQKKEIYHSINVLNKKMKMQCKHYSYPEGFIKSYNKNTINLLKSKKILICPTAINGVNDLNSDLFKLKRISIN